MSQNPILNIAGEAMDNTAEHRRSPIVEKGKNENAGPKLWLMEPGRYPGVLESFQTFRTKLLSFYTTKSFKMFVITGAERQVGVSTVAFNLGIVSGLDVTEKKILIVDANLKKPALHQTFQIPKGPGLLDHLNKKARLTECLKTFAIKRLNLLPIGDSDSQNLGLFDSEAFAKFLEEAKAMFDIILFDTAPALFSSETRMVASKADGVIMVAEANRTRTEVVSAVMEKLDSDGAKVIGSFLNRRRFVIPGWLYRYV